MPDLIMRLTICLELRLKWGSYIHNWTTPLWTRFETIELSTHPTVSCDNIELLSCDFEPLSCDIERSLRFSWLVHYVSIITDGKGQKYSSPVDALRKAIQHEGLRGLYKGFIPNWLRIGPHTLVTFFVFEQLRKIAGIRPVWLRPPSPLG